MYQSHSQRIPELDSDSDYKVTKNFRGLGFSEIGWFGNKILCVDSEEHRMRQPAHRVSVLHFLHGPRMTHARNGGDAAPWGLPGIEPSHIVGQRA